MSHCTRAWLLHPLLAVSCAAPPPTGLATPGPTGEVLFHRPELRELARAAAEGDTDRIEALLQTGVNVNAQGRDGITPLMCAIVGQSRAGVRGLLDAKAEQSTSDDHGHTSITLAAGLPDTAILELLLERGADVNQSGPAGATPLIIAVAHGHPAHVAVLLRSDARPDLPDERGRTALHHATLRGDAALAGVLLANRAEAFAQDLDGVTPYALASRSSDPALRDLFHIQ